MKPSEPFPITSPRYDAVLDVNTGILTITRNDKNGKLSYEQAREMMPKICEGKNDHK